MTCCGFPVIQAGPGQPSLPHQLPLSQIPSSSVLIPASTHVLMRSQNSEQLIIRQAVSDPWAQQGDPTFLPARWGTCRPCPPCCSPPNQYFVTSQAAQPICQDGICSVPPTGSRTEHFCSIEAHGSPSSFSLPVPPQRISGSMF